MPTITGPVKRLQVTPTLGKVIIRDEDENKDEGFLFWNRAPTTISDRIIHSMWVSLAREAIAQDKKVTIGHVVDSALVSSFTLTAGS